MSLTSRPVLTLPVKASGTVNPHRFVTPAGAQAGADANAIGVSRTLAAVNDQMPIDVLGTTTIEAGAAISVGATLKSDASGRAITWATSGAKIALALEAASGAGAFIEALLIPNVA